MQVARHASISRTKTGISPGRPIGRRWLRAAFALAALLALVVPGSAQAYSKVYEEGEWDNTWTDTACGYDIDGRDWGQYVILDARAQENYQFFYFSNRYHGHTKVTNPANGKWFTEDWSGSYREINARQYGDDPNVFAYEGNDTTKYRVADRHGKIVYRDRGTVITSFIFDTLGDSAPGGEYLADPVELKNTWDPDFDFCKLADGLIG
jgi:hypothetical protein